MRIATAMARSATAYFEIVDDVLRGIQRPGYGLL
jgi:hypothetical protein